MKLYFYQGLDDEIVPRDVTHAIIDDKVTAIKRRTFYSCHHLVSIIMGDNVNRIKKYAFYNCYALRYIRLSKTLEFIEEYAFVNSDSVEAVFLPSTGKEIEEGVFMHCRSLRLLILPNDIDLSNVGVDIISNTGVCHIAEASGVAYEYDGWDDATDESNRRVNEWLIHHMDTSPFHKLCYNSSVTTKQINDYLTDHGDDSALTIDAIHGMTPLHMLSMNPHAPADAAAVLLNVNMEVAFRMDNQGKTPIDYARDYNVGGLIVMIGSLCNHRHSTPQYENAL
eukprot:CAMPEP_0194105466 /NCGR_PEP_ID=MMETSP0150-20130528/5666_1 /TAXON_ID=122233 /ORGANISM="Chaetoceros debilis, Strain MM31A-1" /LENGTH=280 /DNA_ID=CAMNT_0038793347 /DNA_START=311 /DNA_END=1153 /DNA_ORIENTATION=+